MSDPNNNAAAEPNQTPALSPEALAIMAKARRSFLISIGVLLLGFTAIGFALVYRAIRDKPPAEMAAQVSLPAGAEVVSSMVAEGKINVTYRAGGVVHLGLYDPKTGLVIIDVTLVPAQ